MRTEPYHPLEKQQLNYVVVGGLEANFQRTVRVPQDRVNSLPAGLGSFPIYRVADFRSGAPKEWREEGFFLPMYRQEAMWISFPRRHSYGNPKALIVGAGNINAVTGKPFDPSKTKEKGKKSKRVESGLDIKLEKEQNYLVIPPQPWLDGWKAPDGKVYQFVAAELGSGETVEGQITGEEKVGGIQLIVYDPKPGQTLIHASRPHEYIEAGGWPIGSNEVFCLSAESYGPTRGMTKGAIARASVHSMGLGRGGSIEQKIYPDPHGLEVWNEKPTAVEVLYIVSSEDFQHITGHPAPPTPVTMEAYQRMGLPWFGLHDQKLEDSPGSDIFAKLKPVGEGKAKEKVGKHLSK